MKRKHPQIRDWRRFWEIASLPFRFLTPFSIRSSRRLRNSLRSDILDALLRRVPSKSEFRRLNLQWLLQLFPKTFVLNIATSYHANGGTYS